MGEISREKNKIYLSIISVLLICLIAGYFLLLKRTPENADSGVPDKAEQQKIHEEAEAKGTA